MLNGKFLAVIVGVGPGLGLAIAKKFISEDFNVVVISRNSEHLSSLLPKIDETKQRVVALSADVTDENDIISVFKRIHENYGHSDVLIYNASGKFELKGICEISPSDFISSWKACCLGGLLTAQQVIPHMLQKQKGSIIFTGATAAIRGSSKMASFAVGKFSQRALSQSMARELAPQGIHVAHVIIDGYIATPTVLKYFPDKPLDTFLSPEDIAETYWQLHRQDKRAWTHEIDLRPYTEKF